MVDLVEALARLDAATNGATMWQAKASEIMRA